MRGIFILINECAHTCALNKFYLLHLIYKIIITLCKIIIFPNVRKKKKRQLFFFNVSKLFCIEHINVISRSDVIKTQCLGHKFRDCRLPLSSSLALGKRNLKII